MLLKLCPAMRKKYTSNIIAVFPANTLENMTELPNEPFSFLVIARSELCDEAIFHRSCRSIGIRKYIE
jgi:hypothetical protein